MNGPEPELVAVPAGEELLLLPKAQVVALGLLLLKCPDSTWHVNECGCCVCLHPGGRLDRAYIVNADGDPAYYEGDELVERHP